MEPWQHGIELAELKARTAIFEEMHKPYVFGAFGMVTERDIAESNASRACWNWGEEAAVVGKWLRQNSTQSDFTGRHMSVHGPCLMVKAVAGRNVNALKDLLVHVQNKCIAAGVNMYVEIFEEDEICKAAIADFGAIYCGTKVMAASEIKGLYLLHIAQSGFWAEAPAPYEYDPDEEDNLVVRDLLLSNRDVFDVCAELQAHAEPWWAQHYSSYNKRKSWTAFALRGFSNAPEFIIKPTEMSEKWQRDHASMLTEPARWTPLAQHFPKTRKLLMRLGCEFERVRFMRLASAGGELSRHADITDRDAGVQSGRVARLHIPIVTNMSCQFSGWGIHGEKKTRHFPEGALCYLDTRKPHQVLNLDPKIDRIHLVVDVICNPQIRATLFG